MARFNGFMTGQNVRWN